MEDSMRSKLLMLLLILTFLPSGCYGEITGTVVDAQTGKPIEGAVVLAEWTITKGLPGMSYTETYKTIEVLTEKNGRFTIPEVFHPLVNRPPHFVVYKKGYIAWSNQYIFPTWEKRKDFEYKNGLTIRLEHFKKGFSHYDHVSFISSAAISGGGGKLLEEAYSWERILARQELEKRKREVEGR